MDDPRFKHVATDPRFKAIPRKARKVKIDSRFQSMFTDKKFKVKYAVDRRGRKVNQSSSEDLRKYYEIDEDELPDKTQQRKKDKINKRHKEDEQLKEEEEHPVVREVIKDDVITSSEDTADSLSRDSDGESDNDSSSSSTDVDEITFDLNTPASKEIVHDWGVRSGRVPHSDETSHRLAICNMDWDRLSANDIFVLLNSFKPRGGSILKVTIYPSDFGLERLAREEVEGPTELVHGDSEDDDEEGSSNEGDAYSTEKLRSYQLNRLRYYYAVAECDSKATAEVIYEQCDGLEYECSGGQIDLRFIPDDVTFDDREPKSVATESTVPVNFTPSNFVSTALQQSKVEMTWDETDPKRLQTTMRKFTKEDVQSMDFGAYLASSSSDDSCDEGEGPSEGRRGAAIGSEKDRIQMYKDLLKDSREDKGESSAEEEMEITWEPGLSVAATKDLLKKKKTVDETTWEKYLKQKRQKKKEKNVAKMKEPVGHERTDTVSEGKKEDAGFDDPFFQHDVTTATAKSKKSKKSKLSQEELERDKKAKSELELLMLENDEEDTKQHFNLKAIMKQEREASKKQQRKRKKGSAAGDEDTALVDGFEIDVRDPRFSALYESHLYAPDPANPHFKATKAMETIMKERLKRSKNSSNSSSKRANPSRSFTDPSIASLVNSVKSKTSSFKEKQRKRKKKEPL